LPTVIQGVPKMKNRCLAKMINLLLLMIIGLSPTGQKQSWSAPPTQSMADEEQIISFVTEHQMEFGGLARKLWEYAELAFQEVISSNAMLKMLQDQGFSIESGIAKMPTAFLASYGEGRPILGILAEYDALPGLSQDAVPYRKPLIEGGVGHGCGHCLFGAGSVSAAIAVKNWLSKTGCKGTIRLYGTPAEEMCAGKMYFVRAGLFNDVDAVLHWHPYTNNNASPEITLFLQSVKFRFYGTSAHASMVPERGRSALDAVEAMNHMVNMMREHIPSETRIHYVITNGGVAPNVVPDFSEVYYFIRHPELKELESITSRVIKTAEGAAMGTETKMKYEIITGCHSLLPNLTLARIVDKNLHRVGGIQYTPEEREFAEAIFKTFESTDQKLDSISEILPLEVYHGKGSTDVGDVSWVVPTTGLDMACWVPGTAPHSWQATATSGMSIGFRGMLNAAKIMALTCAELYRNPEHIQKAWEELKQKRGENYQYKSLVGDRDPPLPVP